MARKRVIYQSEALLVGGTGSGNNPSQLHRVQSANYSFEVTRTDVNQFGQLAAIDRIIVEQPTVSLDFSYFLQSGGNESNLGLTLSSSVSALSGILAGAEDAKNYFIYVASEGMDAAGDTLSGQSKLIGIGNGFLTSYSAEASVGEIPTATANVEALNMRFYNTATGAVAIPTVNPVDGTNASGLITIPVPSSGAGLSALRPGDITFTLDNLAVQGATASELKIQSFTYSFDIGREPLQKLGTKFAFSKEITFPVTATLSVDAILGEIESDNLADLVNADGSEYNLTITLNQPGTSTRAIEYTLLGAKLDSQSFSSSIGDNKSVTLEFSSQVGGPQDTAHGIRIRGLA